MTESCEQPHRSSTQVGWYMQCCHFSATEWASCKMTSHPLRRRPWSSHCTPGDRTQLAWPHNTNSQYSDNSNAPFFESTRTWTTEGGSQEYNIGMLWWDCLNSNVKRLTVHAATKQPFSVRIGLYVQCTVTFGPNQRAVMINQVKGWFNIVVAQGLLKGFRSSKNCAISKVYLTLCYKI